MSSDPLRWVGTRSSKNSPLASRWMSTAKSFGLSQVRAACLQRDAISRTFKRAPMAANLDSMCFAFICFNSWFQSETHRPKYKFQPRRRTDSEDTFWFVALAKEQVALITEYGFHWFPFVKGLACRAVANRRGECLECPPTVTSARQPSPAPASRAKAGGW